MEKFFEQLFKSLQSLFPNLSLGKKRVLFFLVFFMSVLALWFVEEQFHMVHLWQLTKRTELLDQLNTLAQNGVEQKPELKEIYDQIVLELEEQKYLPITFTLAQIRMFFSQIFGSIIFWKFITGAFWGLIFTPVAIFGGLSKPENRNMLYGAIMFGLAGGILGIALPTIYSPWVNYIAFPIFQLIFLIVISKKTKRDSI